MRLGNDAAPRYDQTVNPAYQIDFTSSSSGKKVSGTKRRVRWRFGYSNSKAIAEGCKGVDCRGEEHEVTLSWSLTSGKRLVVVDGEEVHFSVGKKTQSKFECSWPMRGNHVLQIIAYATPSLKKNTGFRQFDLLLDGLSVFELPRIYELGCEVGAEYSPVPSRRSSQARRQFQAQNQLQREEDTAWAHKLDEFEGRHMMERSASMSVPSHHHSQRPVRTMSMQPVRGTSMPEDLVADHPVFQHQDPISSPLPILQQDPFNAVSQPTHYATNQAPTYDQVANTIMDAYASPSASRTQTETNDSYGAYEIKSQSDQSPTSVIGPANHGGAFFPEGASTPVSKPPPQVGYTSNQTVASEMTYSVVPSLSNAAPSPVNFSETESPVMGPADSEESHENVTEHDKADEVPMNDLQKSFQKLVNIDDIRSTPEKELGNAKLTMEPLDLSGSQKKDDGKSRGLPPTPTSWHMGENATLSQIQSVKRTSMNAQAMRSSLSDSTQSAAAAAAAAAIVPSPGGSFVSHNMAPSPTANGPPPISRVQGFGVGAQVTYDGYSAPQHNAAYAAY